MVLISLFCIVFRYVNAINKVSFWQNPYLYLLLASIFYLIIPLQFYYYEIFRLNEFSSEVIEKINSFTIYYFVVFSAAYLISKDNFFLIKINFKYNKLNFQLIKISVLFSLIIFIALITSKLGTFDLSAPRVDKYKFYMENINSSILIAITWFIIIWSSILAICKKNIWYMALIFPILIFDLLFSSRYFSFLSISAVIVLYYFIKLKAFKPFVLLLFFLFFLSITVLRDSGNFNISIYDYIMKILGEPINSWNSIGLILSSNIKFDPDWIDILIFKILPNPLYSYIFNSKSTYADLIGDTHNFEFGMGSSLITEGYMHGYLFFFVCPLIICLTIYLLELIPIKNISDKYVVRWFILLNIYSIFRGSFLSNSISLLSIYFFIYLIPKFFFRINFK